MSDPDWLDHLARPPWRPRRAGLLHPRNEGDTPMHRPDLIDATAAGCGETKEVVRAVLRASEEATRDAFIRGEDVILTGFGTFKIKRNEQRQGRNPATGEAMTIAASKGVRFKASKPLSDALNRR